MPESSPAQDSIKALQELILRFSEKRDWLQFHNPKNLSMAIVAEAAELLEHFLWVDGESSKTKSDDPSYRGAIQEELADILILSMQFANVTGIDVERAIREKLATNDQKYPADKARGNSLKYTEL